MPSPATPFSWRSIALPALLPTLLFSTGEGAVLPVIPTVADNLGASLAIAGVVAASLTIGELAGTIPSGWLVARVGERPAMIGATGLAAIGLVICLLSPNPVALGFGILLVGLATAVFGLARHAFLTSFVPAAYRARALSTLGGVYRLGFLIGPFITAAAIQLFGDAAVAFWIHLALCVATVVVLVALPDPTATFGAVATVRGPDGRRMREGEALAERESAGIFRTIRRYRSVLLRLGSGAMLIGALRASRNVIIPLWAVSIGIGDTTAAVIIGIAGAVDFALFYAGGAIMDRFGRLWTAVPLMLGLSAGHLVLALTHDVPASATWFVIAAMVLALANGLGSGIILTLGADLADKRNPAPFLGAWRFTAGVGAASAPLAIAAVTAVASLAVAAGVMSALGLLGAGVLLRYIPRFAPHSPREGRAR